MDQKKFKEWFLHYFGLHSVAVGGCIMYSPYYPQLVFAILHAIIFTVTCGMHSCLLAKTTTRYVFNILLIIVCLLDILLLFSITMGVGASGYDTNAKNCYLLEWYDYTILLFGDLMFVKLDYLSLNFKHIHSFRSTYCLNKLFKSIF